MGRMKYTEEERSRIMISFIQATRKIIDTEGIDQVSIRKIANQTGMNSATMYLYFSNADVLITIASMSYLEKHEAYSQYVELLGQVPISMRSKSTVAQLLAARGHYTVFAPTNEAVEAYLQQLCDEEVDLLSAPSWDAFRSE